MNVVLLFAALAALVTFCVHTFIGGRFAAVPLLAARGLSKATIWLNHMTWHMITVQLAVFAAVLAAAALGLVQRDAVLLIAILAASGSVMSIAVTLRAGIPVWRFPASYLLATVAALSAWGACCAA